MGLLSFTSTRRVRTGKTSESRYEQSLHDSCDACHSLFVLVPKRVACPWSYVERFCVLDCRVWDFGMLNLQSPG